MINIIRSIISFFGFNDAIVDGISERGMRDSSIIRFDILPSLKQMGFLDTNARNPDITIAGITLALQFGNALPKYITGRKNITVVDRLAFWTTPCAISQRQVFINKPAFTSL